ncbi:MAG: ketohydroxyglutarate aldolase [Xenococcaceae cyanobacterium]
MSKVNLSVSVDDEHMERILEVAQGLQSAGMNVEQVMDKLGVITGSCDSEKVEALSQVKGALYVERQQEYQLAPPEEDIQ